MVNHSYKSSIKSAKSDADWRLDSDHFPVTMKIQCKFKRQVKHVSKKVRAYSSKQTRLDPKEKL